MLYRVHLPWTRFELITLMTIGTGSVHPTTIRWRPRRSSCIRYILFSLTFKDIFFLEFRNIFLVICYVMMNLYFMFSQMTSPTEYFDTSVSFHIYFLHILWMYFWNKSFIWLSITIAMKTFGCFLSFKIDVGENQRGNPEWRIQRHLQHWERVTQDEDKNKKQTNKQTKDKTKQNKQSKKKK